MVVWSLRHSERGITPHRSGSLKGRTGWPQALRIAALASLSLWIAGCGDKTPKLSALEPGAVILAYGDSLTYGTGARPEDAYPARLAERLNRTVINAGVPGETSSEGLERLPSVLEDVDPDLVILCLGGNDMLRQQDRSRMRDNLAQMVSLIRAYGAEVLLLAVPEPKLLVVRGAPEYTELATATKTPLQADIIPKVLGDRALKSDTVHPNAAGYAKIAEAIERLLLKAGAI